MKIIELQAENVKRLKAVEIRPDGTVQVIGGNNAQGKSSVLDSIWLALGGGKASKDTPVPIREGQDRASVRLDLGDLVVTRTWTKKGTNLKVESADGAAYRSPQSMLDALVGQLSFDPLAFTRLSPKEQREALLDLVDLGDVDLDAIAAERADLYQQRTDIGRRGKALGNPTFDPEMPTAETSATDLLDQIQKQEDRNRSRRQHDQVLADYEKQAEENRAAIERLQADLAAKEAHIQRMRNTPVDPIVDTAPLRNKLAQVEETNAQIRANNTQRERAREQAALRESYDALTYQIEALDREKAVALAGAKFPVEGLSFDESGVLFEGVPLSQASSAQQIQVSLAMGMALNPKLRVLMIKDGSLLDADSMAAIRDQVAERDYQLLIERVGNADEGAVIIEDGQVQA